jgi:type IV pilus assembly protein PilW
MAGYWGGIRSSSTLNEQLRISDTALSGLTAANDCGPPSGTWAFLAAGLVNGVEFLNQSSTANASYGCIVDNQRQANTDVVAIRRVAAQEAANLPTGTSVTLTSGQFYLLTNRSTGTLFRQSGNGLTLGSLSDCRDSNGVSQGCQPIVTPVQAYVYQPRLYYVRNFANTVGDEIPTVCRKVLSVSGSSPRFEDECLANDIENLQLEWGLDTDNDGVVNRFSTSPTTTEMAQAVNARVFVLARTRGSNRDGTGIDAKTYTLADVVSNPDTRANTDPYVRRLYSTVVQLKNRGL